MTAHPLFPYRDVETSAKRPFFALITLKIDWDAFLPLSASLIQSSFFFEIDWMFLPSLIFHLSFSPNAPLRTRSALIFTRIFPSFFFGILLRPFPTIKLVDAFFFLSEFSVCRWSVNPIPLPYILLAGTFLLNPRDSRRIAASLSLISFSATSAISGRPPDPLFIF